MLRVPSTLLMVQKPAKGTRRCQLIQPLLVFLSTNPHVVRLLRAHLTLVTVRNKLVSLESRTEVQMRHRHRINHHHDTARGESRPVWDDRAAPMIIQYLQTIRG